MNVIYCTLKKTLAKRTIKTAGVKLTAEQVCGDYQ